MHQIKRRRNNQIKKLYVEQHIHYTCIPASILLLPKKLFVIWLSLYVKFTCFIWFFVSFSFHRFFSLRILIHFLLHICSAWNANYIIIFCFRNNFDVLSIHNYCQSMYYCSRWWQKTKKTREKKIENDKNSHIIRSHQFLLYGYFADFTWRRFIIWFH